MGLQPVKTTVSSGVPVWQKVLEVAQGGFILDNSVLTDGDTVKAGTPIGINESTRKAKVVKTAQLHANALNSDTDYQVEKGHHFKVGDKVGKTEGGAAYAITAIDTSNADYDVITVGTTLGVALTAGDVLFESSASGGSAAAVAVTPNGLLYDDVDVADGASLSVVLRGTVYDRRIPAAGSVVKAKIPQIIFSQSY
jgi:hypothetical protein